MRKDGVLEFLYSWSSTSRKMVQISRQENSSLEFKRGYQLFYCVVVNSFDPMLNKLTVGRFD